MGLFDFLKRKKKAAAASEGDSDGLLTLGDGAPEGIEPPETRYTQEYADFLASQEDAGDRGEDSGD